MNIGVQNNSERVFARLCSYYYLRSFVFHSPRIYAPTEIELGDVLLWLRTLTINFELIWRNPTASTTLKSFVKRVGEKRDQLERDFQILTHMREPILLENEFRKELFLKPENIIPGNYLGVVLIDSQDIDIKLHFNSLSKVATLPFACNYLSFQGLKSVLDELDTISDLAYYLSDRAKFVNFLLKNYTKTALIISSKLEKNIIAFYKMHENVFVEKEWDETKTFQYWDIYQNDFQTQIARRNEENRESEIIDRIVEIVVLNANDPREYPLHAWELAILTRRQRATKLAPKIHDAITRMHNKNKHRYFSFLNQVTGCWLLFYFQHGGSKDEFIKEVNHLARLKTVFEIVEKGFKYSVFVYGFRKSEIETGNTVDDIYLTIEDAEKYKVLTESEITEAKKLFGHITEHKIKEFPD